jgi:hypothetical protein
MKRLLWMIGAALVCQVAVRAQVQLDEEALRSIPPEDAVVLDPVADWQSVYWPNTPHARIVGIDQDAGHPTMRVAEPGKRHPWERRLAIPFDPQRYPIVVMSYRATGILATEERLLWLDDTSGAARGKVQPFLNEDLIADGEIHEVTADLRELSPKGKIIIVRIYPHCHGPEPAVFELLGLRFESEHDLPPRERREEPEFSVRVVDEKGAPMAGALVTVDAERLNWSRSAATDATGKATVRAVNNPDDRHMLRVTAKGMLPLDVRMDEPGGAPTTVQLTRAVSYGGLVMDEDGEPIPHASVGLQARWSGDSRTTTVLADAEGRWQASLMPATPRGLTMALRHQEYVSGPAPAPPIHQLCSGKANLVMRRGLLFSGIVIGPDGTCVHDAQVRQGRDRWQRDSPRARTDEEGRFEFPQSMPGKLVLTVQADDFAPALAKIDLQEGMEEPIIELEPPATIRGRVVNSEGAPIAGVRVAVSSWRGSSTITWNMTTPEDGLFEWENAPSDEVQFQLTKSGLRSLHGHRLTAGDEEQVVAMSEPLQVEGVVRDALTGESVGSCTLVPGMVWRQAGSTARSTPHWQRSQAVASTDGHFSCTFPQWGMGGGQMRVAYLLKAEARGYAPLISREFGVDEGKRTLDFALKKGIDICGQVRLPDGNLATGAEVFLVTPGSSFRVQNGRAPRHTNAAKQETGADGRYSFPMQTGDWRLVALHDGGYVEMDGATHAKSPGLALLPWARVEGTCHIGKSPANGRNMQIQLLPSERSAKVRIYHEQEATTDGLGSFVFPRVPPGKGVVGIRTALGAHSSTITRGQECEFVSGKTLRLAFGGKGRPVTGQLAVPQGATGKMDWAMVRGSLRAARQPAEANPLLAMAKLPPAERAKRWREWLKSKAGKAFVERQRWASSSQPQPELKQYAVSVQADGTFRAEDIPAGLYALSFRLGNTRGNPLRPGGGGRLRHRFTVPEMTGDRSDGPLDLGPITVPFGAQPTKTDR